MIIGPAIHNSPLAPGATAWPSSSIAITSAQGSALPTVSARVAASPSGSIETGDVVSVEP